MKRIYVVRQTTDPKELSYIESYESGTHIGGAWIFTTKKEAEDFKAKWENNEAYRQIFLNNKFMQEIERKWNRE